MIEERATVLRSEADQVWVEVSRQSACAVCASSSTCGQKRLSDWFPSKRVEVLIDNPSRLIVSPGQEVWVGLEEGALVGASVTVYLVPLLGMILLPILAKFLNFSEFFQIVGAILGFIVGVFIGRYMGLRGVASGQYQPRLLR